MIEITRFNPRDYDDVNALWRATEHLTPREVDSRGEHAGGRILRASKTGEGQAR